METTVDTTELLWKQGSPGTTILRTLQRQGPSTVKQLEQVLGVSTNAVREQLAQLQAADLLLVTRESHGAGRPVHRYSLTQHAQQLLSHRAESLLNLLLEEILAVDGPAKLQALLDGVGRRMAAPVHVDAATDIHARLQDVRAAFARQNISLTLVEDEVGARLHTWSCPYVEVAAEHRGICEMETHMLAEALGQPVHLLDRIVDGAAGCCFVVGNRPAEHVGPDDR